MTRERPHPWWVGALSAAGVQTREDVTAEAALLDTDDAPQGSYPSLRGRSTGRPREAASPHAFIPFVLPNVRTAAVDRTGQLWVTFLIPYTYVFDAEGEKTRTVQFRGAGILQPSSVFFSQSGRILVTPGCYEFPVR